MTKTKASKTVLPILAIAVGAMVFISQRKKAISNMNYSIGVPYAMSISKGNLLATLPITFDNASTMSTNFEDLYLDILKDGKVVGNVKKIGKVSLPSKSRTKVSAQLSIYGERVGMQLSESILSKTNTIKALQIKGVVKAEGFNLFIDKQMDMPISLNVSNSILDAFRSRI